MEKKTPKKRKKLSKKQEEKRKLAKSLKNKRYGYGISFRNGLGEFYYC